MEDTYIEYAIRQVRLDNVAIMTSQLMLLTLTRKLTDNNDVQKLIDNQISVLQKRIESI